MGKRMTVVFHDDDLYTELKVAAVRRHKPASDIVSEAVREWLERREDVSLLPAIAEARAEWQEKGGCPWPASDKEAKASAKRGKPSKSVLLKTHPTSPLSPRGR